ncbi:hypothetical protein W97_09196 [Coniosporium apollinis CBS 100218]|uniref:Uncharacterized protein n=1 Tax=Coniosporium apollinis (strain CBS 100218) TaxID=1168221 RepID=R7Z7K6_CONA1|nr:uncharacterized protein W97_09196 [Coniosporium apollinis CBS 100218]EON69931.1 hypothetical protein W97_09196 [Coniosporium apollinis CBS 100218]
MLVELAQQLAWIGAALSPSPFGEATAYSEAKIAKTDSGPLEFELDFHFNPLHSAETSCWLPLFCGASIAHGFPIAERQDEMGVEVSLDIAAEIAGVQHAVEFAGGVVMKGFSSMLVPIRRQEDRIQWHLLSSLDPETRLSYREVLDRCPNRATLEEVSLESLRATRAILGWCSAATSLLGSKTANYENIAYSGAEDAAAALSITGGVFGISQFGVAQANVTILPKWKHCYKRSGTYNTIISDAEKTPVVLYDTGEKRAWLVPASSVMLHMAHHRNWIEPFQVNGKRIKLGTVGPTGPYAKEVLLNNALTNLSDLESEPYTFKDMILNIWSILEFLLAEQVERDRNPGLTVNGSLQDVVKGVEFKAIVQRRSPVRQKQATIQKTSGGWPALVRDIDALVLFADGYEDVIQPLMGNCEGLCHMWKSMPRGKDYLATRVGTLEDLRDVAGPHLGRTYLISTRLQWHRGNSSLFEPCKTPQAFRCQCERLQRIVPNSAVGRIIPPGYLVDDGAVIFGQSNNFIRDFVTAPQRQESSGIYSQPNVNIALPSSIDDVDEIPPFLGLDRESPSRSGSDGTQSPPTSSTAHRTLPYEGVAASMLMDTSRPSTTSPCVTNKRIYDLNIEALPGRKTHNLSLKAQTKTANVGGSDNKHDLDLHREALCRRTLCPSPSRFEDAMGHDVATQPQSLHTDKHARVGEWRQSSEKTQAGSPDVSVTTSQKPDLPHGDNNHERRSVAIRIPTQTKEVEPHALDPGSVPLIADDTAFEKYTLPPQEFDVTGQGDDPPSNNQAKHPLRRQRRFCRFEKQAERDDHGCSGTVALVEGVVTLSGGV